MECKDAWEEENYLWREKKVNENELFIHQELFRYM